MEEEEEEEVESDLGVYRPNWGGSSSVSSFSPWNLA